MEGIVPGIVMNDYNEHPAKQSFLLKLLNLELLLMLITNNLKTKKFL
jgi:hypothetical protein